MAFKQAQDFDSAGVSANADVGAPATVYVTEDALIEAITTEVVAFPQSIGSFESTIFESEARGIAQRVVDRVRETVD